MGDHVGCGHTHDVSALTGEVGAKETGVKFKVGSQFSVNSVSSVVEEIEGKSFESEAATRHCSPNNDHFMKRIISLAAVLVALLALSSCDKKTSDDLKQKAEEASKSIAKDAKEAADKGIEKGKELAKKAEPKIQELKEKAKEAAKDAEPQLKALGEKAKEATSSAVEKVKDAVGATPTPAP